MKLDPFIIYLWGIADQLPRFVGMLVMASFFFAAGSYLFSFTLSPERNPDLNGDEYRKDLADQKEICKQRSLGLRKNAKMAFIIAIAMTITCAFFPNSKTIALMIVVPAIINSEPIQKDLPEIYQMAKDALKQTLETK